MHHPGAGVGKTGWMRGSASPAASAGRPSRLQWAIVVAGSLLLAFLLAQRPLLTGGAVLGATLLLLVVWKPIAVLAVLFAMGPLDLSFITGGLKALDIGVAGGLDMNGIRLSGVVGGLAALTVINPRIRAHAFGRYGRYYALFLAYAAFTLVFSPVPFDGLRFLFKLAYPFLIFVVVLGASGGRADLDRIIDWTLIGAAILTVVVNPFYVAAGSYEVDFEGRMRLAGLGVHQNPFSFYLLAILLISLMRFWVRRQWRYLGLCAAAAIWIGLTLTRSTMLATAVAIAALGLYSLIATRRVRSALPIALIGVVILFLFVPAFIERTFPAGLPSLSDIAAVWRDPLQIAHFANISGREVLWAVVIAGFLSSPVLGMGLGASSAMLVAAFPIEYGHVAHNEYLRLLADTGLIGAGLFGLAMLVWGRGVLRALGERLEAVNEYALPALAMFVAWLVISLSDNAIDYYAAFSQYVGFACAAALVAAREATGGEGDAPGDEDDTTPER